MGPEAGGCKKETWAGAGGSEEDAKQPNKVLNADQQLWAVRFG